MAKVLAVGDLHTKLEILNLVEKVIVDYDTVVFCGDYADDWDVGPLDSILAWQELMLFANEYAPKVVCLLGNHDYIYVHKTPSIQTGYSYVTQTLLNAPENKDIKNWLLSLPITYAIDDVIYSHAGVTDEWAEKNNGEENVETLWNNQSPLWVRPQDGLTYTSNQVFGHTPSETCWDTGNNAWCIDTFSTKPNGESIGDNSLLVITDGKTFDKIKL